MVDVIEFHLRKDRQSADPSRAAPPPQSGCAAPLPAAATNGTIQGDVRAALLRAAACSERHGNLALIQSELDIVMDAVMAVLEPIDLFRLAANDPSTLAKAGTLIGAQLDIIPVQRMILYVSQIESLPRQDGLVTDIVAAILQSIADAQAPDACLVWPDPATAVADFYRSLVSGTDLQAQS